MPLAIRSTVSSISRRRSLHSEMSPSRRCTALHVSLCFSKNQAGVGRSQMRQRIGSASRPPGAISSDGSVAERQCRPSSPYRANDCDASSAAWSIGAGRTTHMV